MAENMPPATNSIEDAPLASLKSAFDVPEHEVAADGGDANKSLAERLVDSKPVTRKEAYAELAKLFSSGGAEAAAAFDEHASTLKKMLLDNASLCHDSALDAAIAFAKSAPVEQVQAGAAAAAAAVVEKHASGKLQAKALDALLVLVETGAGATHAVQNALLSGAAHKVPKVRAAAAKGLTSVIRAFGASKLELKAVSGVVVGLVEHRDKAVREEGLALLGELRVALGDDVFKMLKGLSGGEKGIGERESPRAPRAPRWTRRDIICLIPCREPLAASLSLSLSLALSLSLFNEIILTIIT